MAKVSKMNILVGLFLVLLLILVINPRIIMGLYSSILGRVVLILVVVFFSMNNITLGLLTALVVIIASNMFLTEGLDNMDNTSTTTTSTTSSTAPPSPEALQAKKDELKQKLDDKLNGNNTGVDLETIKNSVQSKSSNSLPATTSTTSTTEPAPSSQEAFRSMYASI